MELQRQENTFKKIKASVSKMKQPQAHNRYKHNVIINYFLALKHGHILAAVLSHAQLWFLRHEEEKGPFYKDS